jgi:hypothetical protein
MKETTLLNRNPGDIVNLENDIVGKYVERLMNFKTDDRDNKSEERNNSDSIIFLLKPKRDIDQCNHHGYFHKWPNDSSECYEGFPPRRDNGELPHKRVGTRWRRHH